MNGRFIACEQTPANVFYIADILDAFPNARVLVMVRDPRAVLLSQKGKWRRRNLGEKRLPLVEPVRAWFNYHPVVVARLWKAAVEAGERYEHDDRVQQIAFESLLKDPESTMLTLCEWLDLDFLREMLEVPQWSSSNEPDSDTVGIKAQRAERWREGGLTETEVFVCERMVGPAMARHGYTLSNARPPFYRIAGSALLLPFKLAGALPLNLRNLGNPVAALRKRLSAGR